MNEGALLTTCPHCGALARIEPRERGGSLSWVCGVCGGPRMPNGLGGEAAIAPLKEAKAARGRATRSRAISWVFALMAAFATLVALAAWPAALVAKAILLALAVTPAVFAARSRTKAGRATAEAEEAMNRAWLAAAEDAVERAKAGLTAAELGKQLHIEPARAESLLTQLAVHDRTRIDVDDDAEVRYSLEPAAGDGGGQRVRVGDDALVKQIEEAARAKELEAEAEANEEAARSGTKGARVGK